MRIQRILRKAQCKLGYHKRNRATPGLWYGQPVIAKVTCECGTHWQSDPNAIKVDYKTMVEFAKKTEDEIAKYYDDAFFNAITKLQ